MIGSQLTLIPLAWYDANCMFLSKTLSTLALILFSLACWSDNDRESFPKTMISFSNVTQEVGITFRHFDGRQGDRYFIETIGSGCAFLDYNNDGLLDLYLVNANHFLEAQQKIMEINR